MTTSSQYRPSQIDGLPARVSGHWAQEKLAYLAKYMSIFNVGMKNRWQHRVYIDLLAGPGRCVDETGVEFEGSPLLANSRDEPFSEVVLIESDSVEPWQVQTRNAGPRSSVMDGGM